MAYTRIYTAGGMRDVTREEYALYVAQGKPGDIGRAGVCSAATPEEELNYANCKLVASQEAVARLEKERAK